MSIRITREEDLEKIYLIIDKYWDDKFGVHVKGKIFNFVNGAIEDKSFEVFTLMKEGVVMGFAALRNTPNHMSRFSNSPKSAEFYVIAVDEKGKGHGKELRDFRLDYLRERGYEEVIFFSGETHKDSWDFHDSYAKRVGDMNAPDGERGVVWRLDL